MKIDEWIADKAKPLSPYMPYILGALGIYLIFAAIAWRNQPARQLLFFGWLLSP